MEEETSESESDKEEPKEEQAQENFRRSSYGRIVKPNSKYKALLSVKNKLCINLYTYDSTINALIMRTENKKSFMKHKHY